MRERKQDRCSLLKCACLLGRLRIEDKKRTRERQRRPERGGTIGYWIETDLQYVGVNDGKQPISAGNNSAASTQKLQC